jgi:hypothetical protein
MEAGQAVVIESPPLVTPEQVEEYLGWTLKPEGLCRDERCVLVPDRDALHTDDGVDLRVVTDLLDRPIVVDREAGLVAIGAERSQRLGAVRDAKAPDFSLPDLNGDWHSFADHRSKKKLLVAFSSW